MSIFHNNILWKLLAVGLGIRLRWASNKSEEDSGEGYGISQGAGSKSALISIRTVDTLLSITHITKAERSSLIKALKNKISGTTDPMNCTCVFSLVTILVFSFQYYSQSNHFIWEMICSFIFSDWLMSPGCCQIRICYPKYSPQEDLPLVQKCTEWKKAGPDSSWAVGKHHLGLNGKSGVECSFGKQIFKKNVNIVKNPNNPEAVL